MDHLSEDQRSSLAISPSDEVLTKEFEHIRDHEKLRLLNPGDWVTISTSKDSTGRYYFPRLAAGRGPRADCGAWPSCQARPWLQAPGGLGFAQSRLYRRDEVRVDFSESVAQSFEKNQVVFRAESRLQVAWLRPASS
jgi:hypothetical protein